MITATGIMTPITTTRSFGMLIPNVYGYDEYAQQFTPPVRKTVKRRNVVAGKSNKVTKGVGAERLRKKAEARKNDTIYMIVYLAMLAVFLFMCLFFIVFG